MWKHMTHLKDTSGFHPCDFSETLGALAFQQGAGDGSDNTRHPALPLLLSRFEPAPAVVFKRLSVGARDPILDPSHGLG
ncbi:hypothetical protein JOQ06_014823 [Pogonophryne albipinna]|uniref:Uncharacterized protein n=1 Tax=Pogonophryne albipinna TaxID=1090488 RepID=A0AAD6FA38_9TELE|nr:hypothetical protein JOQ06_014823 [Pogonophryne albipinna]